MEKIIAKNVTKYREEIQRKFYGSFRWLLSLSGGD
jgi:hypothetical protein